MIFSFQSARAIDVSPSRPDGGKDLFHHFSEVGSGQRLDGVDGAVGAIVVIHLVLGQRHLAEDVFERLCIKSALPVTYLGILFIMRSNPVYGELYFRPAQRM